MRIKLSDLIPEDGSLVEKGTLFALREDRRRKEIEQELEELRMQEEREKMDVREEREGETINAILELAGETELEKALQRIRYTKEEIEETGIKRKRRIEESKQAVRNAWVRNIKSRSYRKIKRQEKQKQLLDIAQIEANAAAGQVSIEDAAYSLKDAEKEEERRSAQRGAEEALGESLNRMEEVEERKAEKSRKIITCHRYTREKEDGVGAEEDAADMRKPTQMEKILDLEEFYAEKVQEVEKDRPKNIEEVVPGWNAWGGEEIEPVRNATNTKKIKRAGVDATRRKDFGVSHVIYNERASQSRNPKYGVKRVPAGYENQEEYSDVLDLPLTDSQQPLVLLNKLIKEEENRNR